MASEEAAEQANRSGLDPQRLVIGFYLIAIIVVGLFLDHVLGMIWSRLGLSAPREVLEGSGISVTTLIGFVIAIVGAVALWKAPRTHALSQEVASELMKVTWPSWAETRVSTFAVIVASVVSAVILFGIDTAAYKVMVDWLPVLWESSDMAKKWFVVHTYSGFENKAKKSLEDKIRLEGLADQFGEILIPTEQVVEMVKGEKRTSKEKVLPSYMLVQMEMNDRTFHLVKNTPKVTGFVGGAPNEQPPPMSDAEVGRLTQQISEGTLKPKPKVQFDEGDTVRVIDGPFANFNGTVEEVNPDKGRVKVLVSIFGRSTPVELDFMQVEKTGQ